MTTLNSLPEVQLCEGIPCDWNVTGPQLKETRLSEDRSFSPSLPSFAPLLPGEMAAFYANHPSAFATKHPSVLREKYWTKPKDRVIGHVVWAPPISFSTAPYGRTRDVCVIKLDENKLRQNFRGNVLDLGAC